MQNPFSVLSRKYTTASALEPQNTMLTESVVVGGVQSSSTWTRNPRSSQELNVAIFWTGRFIQYFVIVLLICASAKVDIQGIHFIPCMDNLSRCSCQQQLQQLLLTGQQLLADAATAPVAVQTSQRRSGRCVSNAFTVFEFDFSEFAKDVVLDYGLPLHLR